MYGTEDVIIITTLNCIATIRGSQKIKVLYKQFHFRKYRFLDSILNNIIFVNFPPELLGGWQLLVA